MDFSNADWRTISSVFAVVISLFSLYVSQRNANKSHRLAIEKSRHDKDLSLKQLRLEIDLKLDKAWRLMGGRIESEAIFEFSNRQELNEAKRLIIQCVNLDDTYAESFRMLGLYHEACGQHGKAEELYNAALKLNQKSPVILNNLGCLKLESDDLDEALKCFKLAIEVDPNYKFSIHNLGYINTLKKEDDKALILYERALEIDEDYVMAILKVGSIEYRRGEFKSAEMRFRKIISLEKDNVMAFYNLGLLTYKQNKTEDAISFFKKAISINPKHLKSYTKLAAIMIEQGKHDEATLYYKKLLELEPDHVEANKHFDFENSAQRPLIMNDDPYM